MNLRYSLFLLTLLPAVAFAQPLANGRYSIAPGEGGVVHVTAKDAGTWDFRGDFSVLVASEDPSPAMRPGNVPRVPYNVITWYAANGATASAALKPGNGAREQAGDGFDDRILKGDTKKRTADAFAAAPVSTVKALSVSRAGAALRFVYPEQPAFTLTAELTLSSGDAEPTLTFTLNPKRGAWYSVGYTGAPAYALADLAEVWQPFIWQEKRFPEYSYMTPAFECPVPATLVRKGNTTIGVVADADEFPFQPLPLLENSRFGVVLRNQAGQAQPMVFAPLLGGPESRREPGQPFTFKLRLFAGAGDATAATEAIGRRIYAFRDFRHNAIASLNETLDNMIDYGLSKYSWFVDELKGCAYSTDVPGAVKNVSSLNPLNLALVTDNEEIFRKRAYPVVEFMLSREKFLFSLDREQKNQSPSRSLLGPCAPVSELAALYGITHGASPVLRRFAERMMRQDRTLNLDDVSEGKSWPNQLAMYRETGEAHFLAAARKGADAYLQERIDRPSADFNAPGFFFWTAFTPKWIDLFQMYEVTHDQRYLDAALHGARQYTQFTWMSPRVPNESVTVNPGGNAPSYWYLVSKGHKPMHAPEEQVPAWRLSEIGLTPESSGTMSGHRGIFMTNFSPWMMRISALTGDQLLHDVARSAVVGRYRNFPGYHINTARTTIYEQADYPLHAHTDLSVNSFHYNHIWPHMSILVDYLVTDAFARSKGAIDFPAHFIEGYAYLQSKFYGDKPGKFYGHDDAVIWLPRHLLKTGTVELNYLSARGRNGLYIAFTNQSRDPIATAVTLNSAVLPQIAGKTYRIKVLAGEKSGQQTTMRDGQFDLAVDAMGITAVEISDLPITPKFQDRLVGAKPSDAWKQDYLELPYGNTRAMILNFGPAATTAYVYLQDDDAKFKQVAMTYTLAGKTTTVVDAAYPFEFTVPLPKDAADFSFTIAGTALDGAIGHSELAALKK